LSSVANELKLSEDDVKASRETLRDYGNMSSPSVLFTLEKILDSAALQNGDHVIMLAFGAGFSCYGMLLRANNRRVN
ncbi:MAG: 3-oxoacyl-[acyl-carrier-protein] synthase III C-terminal domain-containing protein, partial [Candidatus Margulisiibacteriota bacterium]